MRMTRSYNLYGFGQAETAAESTAQAAGSSGTVVTQSSTTDAQGNQSTTTVAAPVDVAALQKEIETLKKENAELKASMGKLLLGGALGFGAGWFIRSRRG